MAGRWHRSSRRVPCSGSRHPVTVAAGVAGPWCLGDRHHRTTILQVDLLPRAWWCAVRDCHRRARLRSRRAIARAWSQPEVTALARTRPGTDRRGAATAPARGGHSVSAEQIGLDRPHVFQPADDAAAGPPLLLLHGTGGDEHDLLPLRDYLSPGAAVL